MEKKGVRRAAKAGVENIGLLPEDNGSFGHPPKMRRMASGKRECGTNSNFEPGNEEPRI